MTFRRALPRLRRMVAGALVATLAVVCAPRATATFNGSKGTIVTSIWIEGECWVTTFEPDGTDPHVLDTGILPIFSPDGTKIAYSYISGGAQTYVMNRDGTGITWVGEGTAGSWSPDGKKIAVTATALLPDGSGFGVSAIFVLSLDGSDPVQVTHPELLPAALDGHGDGGPTWSPDGNTIAFVRGSNLAKPHLRWFARHDLYAVNVSTGIITQLTGFGPEPVGTWDHMDLDVSSPVYSPDGGSIAFTNWYWNPITEGDERRPFVMSSGGGAASVVWSLPDGTLGQPMRQVWGAPTWSPDGVVTYLRDTGQFPATGFEVVKGGAVLFVTPGTACVGTLSWAGPVGDVGQPIAKIKVSETAVAGQYLFDATESEDPDGGPLSYEWDFGNGETSQAATKVIQYEKPGSFHVTLKVKDDEFDEDTATTDVVVKAPQLNVSFGLLDGHNDFIDPEETVHGRLTVSASGDGVGALEHVHFVGAPLRLVPAEPLSIVTGPLPIPLPEFTMQPGDVLAFDYELLGAQIGDLEARSEVAGVDINGDPALGKTATAQPYRVIAPILQIVVAPDKEEYHLTRAPDTDQYAPQDAEIIVTITNVIDRPVANITVDQDLEVISLEGDVTSDRLMPRPPPFVAGPTPSGDIGTLQPGETKVVKFLRRVVNDGNVLTRTEVTYADPFAVGVPGTRVQFGEGKVTIKGDVLIFFEASVPDDTGTPKGGASYQLFGKIRNMSTVKWIKVDPLTPVLQGNAVWAKFQEIGDVIGNPALQKFAPDWYGDVAPGETVNLVALVQTGKHVGLTSKVTYHLRASEYADDGSLTEIPPGQIDNDEWQLSVSIDDTIVDPPAESYLAIFGGWSKGVAQTMPSALLQEGIHLGTEFLVNSPPLGIALKTLQGTAVLARFAQVCSEQGASCWDPILQKAKDASIALQLRAKKWTIAYIFGGSSAVVQSEIQSAVEAASHAIEPWFIELGDAWGRGDYFRVGEMFGNLHGQAIPGLIEAAIGEVVIPLALQNAASRPVQVITLADEAAQANKLRQVTEGVGALKADGAIIETAQGARLFTVLQEKLEVVQAFCKEFRINIGLRTRGELAAERIAAGTHVDKMSELAIKNVTDLDIKYLKYPEGSLDEVLWKPPISVEEFEANLAAHSPLPDEEAIARRLFKHRQDEFFDFEHRINTFNENGRMSVKWNFADNAAGPNVYRDVGFHLEDAGGGASRIQIAEFDAQGAIIDRWKGVTGDTDLVYITFADGAIPGPFIRRQIYEFLQDVLGIQHPETLSWLLGDEAMFGTKAKLLAAHIEGGQPILEIGADGLLRSTFLDPARTVFIGEAGGSWRGWLMPKGGYQAAEGIPQPDFSDLPVFAPRRQPNPFIPASRWIPRGAIPINESNHGKFGEFSLQIDAAADALALRMGDGGSLEQWDVGSGWNRFEPAAAAVASASLAEADGPVIKILPQGVLESDVAPGVTEVAIIDLNELDPTYLLLGGGPTMGFNVGQHVVIDPGGPHEEFAEIAGFGSLIFTAPLQLEHFAGEMVTVVPFQVTSQKPTISAAPTAAPNANGWYNTNVTVHFTCTPGGSAIPAGACPLDQVLSGEGAAVSSTAQTVTDVAGQTSEPSNVITVKIDKTKPTLQPTVSPNPVPLHGIAVVDSGAADALSGIDTATCTALDTSTPGAKRVICTATDKAGNTSMAYKVVTLLPVTADDCTNGGWKGLVNDRNRPFKNQRACVSFVTSSGR